jgi:hypothetical protein
VIGRRAFVYASDLRVADRLALPEGRTAVVTAIRVEHAAHGESFTTYNFAVADTHTYFVGRQGVWVHNMSDNPCKLLAARYLDDVAQGLSEEQAFFELVDHAEEMVASGKLASLASADKHLRDALFELIEQKRLPAGFDLPSEAYPSSSTAMARRLGIIGEDAVGITGPKRGIRIPGNNRLRIPDAISEFRKVITEVKNVKTLHFTSQLRDLVAFCKANGYTFELWVRPSTRLDVSILNARAAGNVTIRYIPGAQ